MPEVGSKLHDWLGELRRRKVFRVAAAYLVLAWLVIQVADAVFAPIGLPAWTMKLVIVLVALGFPLACGLAWAFDVTPRGVERTPPRVLTVAADAHAPLASPQVPTQLDASPTLAQAPVQGAAAAPIRHGAVASVPAGAAPAASVAILPFQDLSPEHDQDYFCEGITEEIVNALCCVRGLRIASRTSAAQYKGRSVDVREIGCALGVGAVLEGSVRKAGDRVRITAQLVSSTDGYHLWSESFDRQLEDVFATQTEIAQKLVAALEVSLTTQETELLERGGTRNAHAYDSYLRGQANLRDGTAVTLPKAVAAFRAAIERDPQFAQAHAGLANALALKGTWRLDMTPEEIDLAFAASARALELEPRMPEAFVARASLLSMQGRAAEADAAFEEAIRLNPASYDAHHLYARHAFATGEFAKAERLFEADHRLRPDDYQALCMLAGVHEALGRSTYMDAGRRALEAIERHLRIEPDDGRAMQLGTVQAAKLGDAARAEAFKQRALALRPNDFATLYNIACAAIALGRRDEALAMLDCAVLNGRGNLGWIEHDPDFASLRGDPGFEAIVSRLRAAKGSGTAGPGSPT